MEDYLKEYSYLFFYVKSLIALNEDIFYYIIHCPFQDDAT